jgi:hypothetical protein
MKSIQSILFLIVTYFIAGVTSSLAGPDYASDETKRVVEAMVDAHGGLEKWRAAPSIRFDNIMHNNYHGKDNFAWWVAHEVIDQKTRKVWQEWPMDDAQIGYDGDDVWSVNWEKGNPSPSMVHFFYYFVNLPWLSQDDGVILSEPARFVWPGSDDELYEVRMTFEHAPGIGKSGNGYYVLYIHPDSYRLVGYQYANGYKPLLDVMNMPEGREVFGPLWRQITRYEEVGGLLFPTAFRTMPEADERIVGNHVILNIDVSTPFEHDKAERPDGAEIFAGPLKTD